MRNPFRFKDIAGKRRSNPNEWKVLIRWSLRNSQIFSLLVCVPQLALTFTYRSANQKPDVPVPKVKNDFLFSFVKYSPHRKTFQMEVIDMLSAFYLHKLI
jgi:hypothetical protein